MAYSDTDRAFALDFQSFGHPWSITGAYKQDDIAESATELDLATAIHAKFSLNVMTLLDAGTHLVRCRVHNLGNLNDAVFALDQPGGRTALTPCSLHTCMCVSLHTNHGGRSGRGRMYCSGLDTDAILTTDPNRFVQARVDFMKTGFTAMKNVSAGTLVTSDHALSVNSRKDKTLYAVTQLSIDTFVDTQRRRVRD
jgi:hypothetical protein